MLSRLEKSIFRLVESLLISGRVEEIVVVDELGLRLRVSYSLHAEPTLCSSSDIVGEGVPNEVSWGDAATNTRAKMVNAWFGVSSGLRKVR